MKEVNRFFQKASQFFKSDSLVGLAGSRNFASGGIFEGHETLTKRDKYYSRLVMGI